MDDPISISTETLSGERVLGSNCCVSLVHFKAGDFSFGMRIGLSNISSFSGVVMSACGSGPSGGIGW